MSIISGSRTKAMALRILIYLSALLVLAMGIMLNTKTTLGVSPINSVPYCVSVLLGTNFGDMTFCLYIILVAIQLTLHAIKKEGAWKRKLLLDVLELPISFVFTRVINLLDVYMPTFEIDYAGSFLGSLGGRLILLALAIVLTGIGASLSLFVRLIPNPGDGIVQGISDFTGKSTGLTKNIVDICCVCTTLSLGLIFGGRIIGIGIGTISAMLFVGRVVAIVDKLFGEKIKKLNAAC